MLDLVIASLTAATVLAVGLELDVRKIPELLRRIFLLPGLVLSQMVLLPALAIFLVQIMPVREDLKIAVLILAACPIGNVANFFSLLARGNLALSVSASASSCLLAPIVMPIVFTIYVRFPGRGFPVFVPPSLLVARILALTWAPLLLGMVLRSSRPNGVARFSPPFQKACAAAIVALCAFVGVTRFDGLAASLKGSLVVSAMMIMFSMAGAGAIAHYLGLSKADTVSYVTAFPARHLGIFATVAVTTLHRFEDLDFVLVYFVLENIVVFAMAIAIRFREAKPTVSA
jgi:bile acid:Na+ symporter, BASS family